MPWSRVEIAGKPADVFDPSAGRPRAAVLFLHDLDGTSIADNPVFTRLLDELQFGCVGPWGDHSWWADRPCSDFDPAVTAEHYLLNAIAPFARERWGLGPRALALVGVGMGGQGALRLAFKHADTFPAVGARAPAIDH